MAFIIQFRTNNHQGYKKLKQNLKGYFWQIFYQIEKIKIFINIFLIFYYGQNV